MDVKLLQFNIMGDTRGSLISIEENKSIPFNIKRVYYIFGTKNDVVRGKHAHVNLEQVLVCTSGSCKILVDDGFNKKHIVLASPDMGLYIGKYIWREMLDFADNTVLMVLASEYYDKNEYIRNYDQFLKEVKALRFLSV